MSRCVIKFLFPCLVMMISTVVWAGGNPYTYVKMSLLVPWTLYFVFLAAILIPFVILIVLSWQRQPGDDNSSDKNH